MKKKDIKKHLNEHKFWLETILKDGEVKVESERVEIKAEIEQLKWIIKMF